MPRKKENDEENKKKQKRANGEGTFVQRNGRWTLTITIGRDPNTGSTIRKSFTGKTKTEAMKKRDEFVTAINTGTFVEPDRITVGKWLEFWFNEFKKPNLSPTTVDRYEQIIINHLIPSLGSLKLQDLRTEHIQVLINNKINNGGIRGKALAPAGVKYIYTVLRAALEKALKLGYINRNPATECNLPKVITSEVDFLAEDNIIKLMRNLNVNDTLDMAILLDLFTGIRKGELIALTWQDIDFENNTISINKTVVRIVDRNYHDESEEVKKFKNHYIYVIKEPKSKTSKRIVPLPASLIPILKQHKLKTSKENLKAGRSQDEFNLVFPSENGTMLKYHMIQDHWERVLKKSNIDHIKFHALRHTYASLLNQKNQNIKVIQLLMGHSNYAITVNTYVHSNSEQKKSAVAKIDYLINFKKDEKDGEDLIKEQNTDYLIS